MLYCQLSLLAFLQAGFYRIYSHNASLFKGAPLSDLPTYPIRPAELNNRKRAHFDISPDADGRAAIADALDVLQIKKLVFKGALIPMGRRDWRLEADLGATVAQPCVVTLAPVNTRIEDSVTRSYIADWDAPDADEIEIDAEDTDEPLPARLDLVDVLLEALTLALPAYPRRDDAPSDVVAVTEPGKEVMTDADARPFAGLAALRDSLENKDGEDS